MGNPRTNVHGDSAQDGLNPQGPDEIVAHGAAIHAAILQMHSRPSVAVAADGSRTLSTPEVGEASGPAPPPLPDLFDGKVVDAEPDDDTVSDRGGCAAARGPVGGFVLLLVGLFLLIRARATRR